MSRKTHEELQAHLARYGIPMPEGNKLEKREHRLQVIKRIARLSRQAKESEQEDLYWPLRRVG